MRCLERNKFTFYYCTRNGSKQQMDEYGNETGEVTPVYDEPVELRANISWATGRADTEQFGVNLDYDRVIVMDMFTAPLDENGKCKITETTVLFVDKEPEFEEIEDEQHPLYDYIVKRVSPSKHYISIAIKRVDVT